MEIESKIRSLEKRYQLLSRDFRAGKIDESRFIAEVDKLQFQDDWGRFWMVGAQSGTWHYYDGQDWQQADPRDADKLPFMDDRGRYWQRGVKSGDWYYYQPETGEWVKPGEGDAVAAPSVASIQQTQAYPSAYAPDPSQFQPRSQDAGPGMPGQLDGQLFQDDEGRYWAIGEKTGQWYFYDQHGWHPAHEFRTPQPGQPAPGYDPLAQQSVYHQPAGQQPSQNYSTTPGTGPIPAQNYVVQPQHPTSPTQPIQIYITSPGHDPQPVGGQYGQHEATQPQQPLAQQPSPPSQAYATSSGQDSQPPAQAHVTPPLQTQADVPLTSAPSGPEVAGQRPNPPSDRSESGSWYYFDGQQWLRYSSGEPDENAPSSPKMVIDQEAKPAKTNVESKSEPVVAEFIEADEPPVEVIDVEVITVIDPEPEPKPEPQPTRTAPPRAPAPAPEPASIADEVRPRRTGPPSEVPRRRGESGQLQPQPRPRTTSEPNRAVAKRETAHEPTIIIPTGAAVSNIAARDSSTARGSRPVKPAPAQRRRARENTMPMEPVRRPAPAAPGEIHRTVTQAMPTMAAARARADTAPVKPPQPAKQTAQQKAAAASLPISKAADAEPHNEGYTLGDVFRSLPSTLWTFVGGILILLVCAVGLIFSWSWFQGDELGVGGLVAVPSLTPTLDAGPPDATPTPGPTSTPDAEADATSTPASLIPFSSADLGFTVEYPENWEQKEDQLCGVFSPSSSGLDPENFDDSSMLICKSAESDAAISDLLTEVLSSFPPEAETLNEGTISIASQIWTSAQIRFEDEDLGGQGIATLAVTNKDEDGYYLMAVAPAEEWNAVQPQFQAMINSFSFSTEAVAQAATPDAEDTEAEAESSGSPAPTRQKTSEPEATPKATPTPKGTATPLVYAVQSGDTLLAISLKFGVDVDLLASKNDIDDPGSLQLGQELIIPFTADELEAFNSGTTDSGAATNTAVADAETPAEAEQDTQPAEQDTQPEVVAADAPPIAAEAAAPADGNPAPVSGRIVYPAFNPGTNIYDLWMADVATGEQTIIAVEASQPAFNKDGSLLAYRSWSLGNRGVFFRDFIGGREGLVTRFVEDGLPIWAPDSYSFVFASRREGDRVPRIFVGNQSGDGDYGIGFQGEYPATFPDGRLVVKGCSPTGDCGLYIMGATGGGETKISSERSDTAPAVSPDGSKIAVMSSNRGATNWEIWVMNADGSNPQRLTNNGSNEGLPAWSPDGQSIAYVSDQGGSWAVWVMNADGSNQRKLFNMQGSPDGKVLRDIDNSKGWLEERISWAP